MPITTSNLAKQVRERLRQIESQLKRLQTEREELRAAVSSQPSNSSASLHKPTHSAKPSAAIRNALSKAKKAEWAEVRRLGLRSLAELVAYRRKQPTKSKPVAVRAKAA